MPNTPATLAALTILPARSKLSHLFDLRAHAVQHPRRVDAHDKLPFLFGDVLHVRNPDLFSDHARQVDCTVQSSVILGNRRDPGRDRLSVSHVDHLRCCLSARCFNGAETASASSFSCTSAMQTVAPREASIFDVSRPIPEAPPVRAMTLPWNFVDILIEVCCE